MRTVFKRWPDEAPVPGKEMRAVNPWLTAL
jgi:hypothetical protein